MRTFRWSGLIPASAAAALVLAVIGCGGGSNTGGPAATKSGGGTTAPPAGAKTAVEGKGLAVLKGTVTYDGTPPAPTDLVSQIMAQADKSHCLKEDPANPDPGHARNWVVKDGKVANVVVWVRPPAGKYFKFTDAEKKDWPKELKVNQPFCHFEPHVSVAFPKYYDGAAKKFVETGELIEVHNGAPITHNTKWQGDARKVPGGNQNLAKESNLVLNDPAKPEPRLEPDWTTPVRLNCDIHKWMEGYIWVLETPYAAVTKDDGTFEIKNIPAGAEVMVVTWQENAGFGDGGPQGKKMTLNAGDNAMDFKVKAK